MPAGRPRKSRAQREFDHNPGKRPLPNEPEINGGPKPPAVASKEQIAVWRRLEAAMPPGVWMATDEALLFSYVCAVALHQQATAQLVGAPLMVAQGSMGQLIANPLIAIQEKAARLIQQHGTRLGLDPAARASLNAPEKPTTERPTGIH